MKKNGVKNAVNILLVIMTGILGILIFTVRKLEIEDEKIEEDFDFFDFWEVLERAA